MINILKREKVTLFYEIVKNCNGLQKERNINDLTLLIFAHS